MGVSNDNSNDNKNKDHTGVCEIEAVLATLSISLQPRTPYFNVGGHAAASVKSCDITAAFCARMGRKRATLKSGDGVSQKTREGESMCAAFISQTPVSPTYTNVPTQQIRGIPKCFFGQVFFGRPGVPRPTNDTFPGT